MPKEMDTSVLFGRQPKTLNPQPFTGDFKSRAIVHGVDFDNPP